MADPRVAILLDPATHRLARAVDAMTDEQWAAPSLLPGWTRGHVVAHVTLNAESLAQVLETIHEGQPAAMYPSQEARDQDITALGARPPGEIRDRFLASSTVITRSIEDLADNLADATFPRVPGAPSSVRAGDVGNMRLREVEIHHVDLGLDYSATDWTTDFAALLLDARVGLWQPPAETPGFTAYADDLDRRWTFGSGGPTVSGDAVDLAWWSTGRGTGSGLTSDDGTMPQIGAW